MQNFIQQLNSNILYQKLLSFLKFLEKDVGWYIGFIVLFFVLITIEDKLVKKVKDNEAKKIADKKIVIWQKTAKTLSILTLLVVLAVSYNRFLAPIFTDIANYKSPVNNTTTPTNNTTSPKNNSTQDTTETQGITPQAPSSQSSKQLYYSVSCSTCWNQSCPRNGYSYGGYQEYYYVYYKSLCQACSCNNFRAQSLWR